MLVSRSYFTDDVINHRLSELQLKYVECISDIEFAKNMVNNNQVTYNATEDEKLKEEIQKNVFNIEVNQKNRLINVAFYESQIKFWQNAYKVDDSGFIEVDERIPDLITE